MTDFNIEALSREFCEMAGIEWHEIKLNDRYYFLPGVVCKHPKYLCTCGRAVDNFVDNTHDNPDYTDAKEVLKLLDKIGLRIEFRFYLINKEPPFWDFVVDDTGLMLKEAVEFLREVKG
jgi:hypothetical protein